MNSNVEKELYEFIDSLGKARGEYNGDELYEIGKRHKNLPRQFKDWEALAEYVGYAGNADSFRRFVSRRCAQEAEMRKIVSEIPESKNLDYETLYKEKTKIRDIYNNYRLTLRDEARLESFKENLFEAIKTLTPLDFKKNYIATDSKDKSEAILMISDMHLGVNCDNFYNKYNSDIAAERVAKLTRDTLDYCKAFKIKRLNVVNLGDAINGNIHINARIQAELSLVDQIVKASEIISQMLATFSENNLSVIYRSCTDNHSRAVANKEENIEEENFSRLIDYYIKFRLQGSNIVFADDNIDISLGKFDLLNGKKVMFAHGHLENVNKCIDAFCGATKEFIDYVLLSHYHNSREKSYNGSKLFINGSLVGTEQHALSKRLFSPAEQKLLIFDQNNILDISINLQD